MKSINVVASIGIAVLLILVARQAMGTESWAPSLPTIKVDLLYKGQFVRTFDGIPRGRLYVDGKNPMITTVMVARTMDELNRSSRGVSLYKLAKDNIIMGTRRLLQTAKDSREYQIFQNTIRVLKAYVAMEAQGWTFKFYPIQYPYDRCKKRNTDGSYTVVC